MLRHVTTKSGAQFVYDNETVKNSNGILVANFIMLRAEKLIRMATRKDNGEKYVSTNYEYTSELFTNLNMCAEHEIVADEPATETLTTLYERISNHAKLGAELQQVLRDEYLKVIDMRNEPEEE